MGDSSASSVLISQSATNPQQNPWCPILEADWFRVDLAASGKGQVEGVRVFSNFSPVGSFPPKTSRLQPKRSVNPGGPMRPDFDRPGYRIWKMGDRGTVGLISDIPSAISCRGSG